MNTAAAMLLVAVILLVGTSSVRGADVLAVEVAHGGNRYAVHFDVRIAASPERLERYLTDYANYAEYFDSIRESTVLAGAPSGWQRIRLRMRSCVLFFCRTLTMVKDVAERAPGEILAHVDPALSDFQQATEHWRILRDNGATRLQYSAELVPDFFVPPLIGPWLLKGRIRASLMSGAATLEALAREER